MLKTSEKNSNKQKSEYSSKPLKEWVTDWFLRHKNDPFFSTRAKIVLFHTLSAVIIIAIAAALIEYAQRMTLGAVLRSFDSILTSGQIETSAFVEMNNNLQFAELLVFAVIILTAVAIGFIASRIALRPIDEALAVQKRFVANVAHELRTPLAVLKTQNEVAMLDVDPDSSIAETLKESVKEIDHITNILNNLLVFNRVDAHESITFFKVDLSTLIERVVSQLHPLAEKKKVLLEHTCVELPRVYGNEKALEQVYFNVIENAIRYTPEGGVVRIQPKVTEKDVTVSVSDNGIGIQKKDLPHIFEPFFRAENGSEKGRGAGLGLAIVFEIIKLHNGKIQVESTEINGTHFRLTIPREPLLSIARRSSKRVDLVYDFTE